MFYCNPAYQNLFDQQVVNSTETLIRFCQDGQMLYRGSISTVWRHRLGDCGIYAKRYQYATPRWRYLFRKSRGKNEVWSYDCFRQLGVHCPEVLAFAEIRNWGRFCQSFIVTKEVAYAVDLQVIFREKRHSTSLRIRIMEQLGHDVALLHSQKFYYHDLKLRNILWKEGRETDEELIFIDCPRGRRMPWHSFRQVRHDLKTLFKDAQGLCSQAEWQSFIAAYAARSRFSVKKLTADYR